MIGVSCHTGIQGGAPSPTPNPHSPAHPHTQAFPFHIAEVYHQYHDGFMWGEDYPASYNALRQSTYTAGRLPWSGCPDIVGRP